VRLLLKILLIISLIITILWPWIVPQAAAKEPRSKFYDFNEQLIDGELKRPTTLYTDARTKVKFDRLLKFKKSFLPKLFKTAKERIFK